jgi:hypothetical protein
VAGCGGGGDAPGDAADAPAGADVTAAVCEPARGGDAASGPRTIAVGGLEREYAVHLPPGYDGTEPAPLVFNLHGFGGDIASQDASTDLPALAGDRGYIVVTPQAAPLDVPDNAPAAARNAGFEGLAFWNFFGSEPGEVTVNGARSPSPIWARTTWHSSTRCSTASAASIASMPAGCSPLACPTAPA